MPNPTAMLRAFRALPLVLIVACAAGVTDANKNAGSLSANTSPAPSAVVAAIASPVPSVIVKNNGGHPVQGVTVTFTVTRGGGSVTGATVETDRNGVAAVGGWTYGTQVGANELSASVNGSSAASVLFDVQTKAGAPSAVAKTNDGQSAIVGDTLPQPVGVIVKDAYGNPVAAQSVTFSASSGTASPASAQTDASGRAQTKWTMASTPGAETMSAKVGSLAPVNLTATATPAPAASVAKSNDNQSGTVGMALASPVSVTVKDKFGNPASGVTVQFAATGNGQVNPASTVTDGSGVASAQWTLPTLAGAASLNATAGSLPAVTFNATANAGAPAKLLVASYPSSGTVFTSVGDSIAVTVTDSYDNLVKNTAVGFVASGNGAVSPSSASTGSTGVAKARWTLPKTAGAANLVASVGSLSTTLNVTAIAGPPASMSGTGSGQTATVAHALANPIVVTVKDAYGNLVSGATVKFSALGTGSSASPASIATDGTGQASTSWTLPNASGTASLSAATVEGNATASFTATATPDAPAQITKGSGDAQTGNAGSTLPQSVVVMVRDQFNNPVPNAPVTFTASAGGSANPANTQADPSGQAAAQWTLGGTAGTQTMTVGSGNAPALTFTATAVAVNSDPCSAKGTVSVGGTVTGDLSTSTCAFGGRGAMIDLWSLNLSGSQPVDIRYMADNNAYDTYMTMYRNSYTNLNDEIGANDDNNYYDVGAGSMNSGIRLLGGTGQFLIGATTFYGSGPYHISVSSWDGQMTDCSDYFAVSGTNTNQTLTSTDCARSSTDARPADKVMVYLHAGETITVGMTSADFDAKVEVEALVNGQNTVVASDDNGGGGTNAKLVYTAPTSDLYSVYLTSPQAGPGGVYNLTIDVAGSGPSATRVMTGTTLRSTTTRSTTRTRAALPQAGTATRRSADAYNSGTKQIRRQ